MNDWSDPPATLRDKDIWIIWGYEERTDKNGDPYQTKVPLDPRDGREGDAADPDEGGWTDYESAVRACGNYPDADGIGYAFPENGTLAGVDLDDVRDPETDETREWAREVLNTLDSYTELSPSGTGFHVVVLGFKPGDRCKRKHDDGGTEIECYTEDRFFTYTGKHVEGRPKTVNQRHSELGEVYHEYLALTEGDGDSDDDEGGEWDGETPDLDLDDEQVLEKARNAKNGDTFERLERGDDSMHGKDTSAADQAFVNYLAFYTGGDRGQIDRLFQASGRMRDKWLPENHSTYRKRTIDNALEGRTEFYDPDGGGRTKPPEFELDDDPDGDEPAVSLTEKSVELTPINVMAEAGLDPDDESLSDLPDREKAFRVWSLIDRGDDEHLVATQPDGTIYHYEDGLWIDEGEQRLRELGRKALGPVYSKNVRVELVEQVRADAPMRHDSMGAPRATVAVRNGLYHLDTGEVEPLKPSDYATFRADAEYREDAECPRFREFVSEVVREDDLDTLQEYAGYTLLHWAQPYKRAMLLLGPQDSGKSTFLNILKAILGGNDNVSAENLNSLVNERWGKASLFGKVANITNELETKTLDSVGLFKTLTGGGDTISAEFKGKDKFDFEPTAKQLFATNQVPPTKDTDDAFYSRWVFASFPESVPVREQVPDLDDELLAEERSGILNWMIEGYERLREQGGFSNDPMSGRKRERWEAYGDSIKRFKHNCLETTGGSDDAIAKSVAHSFYAVYCHEKIGSEVEGQRKFTSELKKDDKIGDSKRKLHPDDQRRKVYTGVKFHPAALDALDFDPGAKLAELRDDGEDEVEDEPDETSLSGFEGEA